MTRQELYREVKAILVENLGGKVTNQTAKDVTDEIFATIFEGAKVDGEVSLPGIGKIKVVDRAERTARNPQTGDEIKVPAHKTLKLSLGKGVKETING